MKTTRQMFGWSAMPFRKYMPDIVSRANPDTTLLPVVVLSSSSARKGVQLAYELRANGYIRKPGDLDGNYKAIDSLKTFWLDVAELPAIG